MLDIKAISKAAISAGPEVEKGVVSVAWISSPM